MNAAKAKNEADLQGREAAHQCDDKEPILWQRTSETY
jgi:hypothetical protein